VTRALITGITGQDGSYLAELLLKKGYEVHGLVRRVSTPNLTNIRHLLSDIHISYGDLADASSLYATLKKSRPDEIYHLGAQSQVAVSYDIPVYSGDITGLGVARLLEATRSVCKGARVYSALSSEVFGEMEGDRLLDEESPFRPRSPYAAAKVYAHHVGQIYRHAYGMFVTNGILFNHESPRRGAEFVTRKISIGVAMIEEAQTKHIVLGNLKAKRDWGFAPEYVECMWRMLQHDVPDDFVVATGESHSVEEFLKLAFLRVGKDYNDYIKVDKELLRPWEVVSLAGDSSKARSRLGWRPRTTFSQLVSIMVDADLKNVRERASLPGYPEYLPKSQKNGGNQK